METLKDPRFISILIGYAFGCFLTAEAAAAKFAGKKASQLGETGNPGMANIMASLGFLPGIITLAGDLGKVIAAGLISHALFPEAGWIVVLYAEALAVASLKRSRIGELFSVPFRYVRADGELFGHQEGGVQRSVGSRGVL